MCVSKLIRESVWSKTIGAYTIHIMPDSDCQNPFESCDMASEIHEPIQVQKIPHYYETLRGYDLAEYRNANGYVADSLSTRYEELCFAISYAKVREEWGKKGAKTVNQHMLSKARKCLKAEIEEYRMWADGECYGYILTALHPDTEEETESCWGFIGFDNVKQEAESILQWYVTNK